MLLNVIKSDAVGSKYRAVVFAQQFYFCCLKTDCVA